MPKTHPFLPLTVKRTLGDVLMETAIAKTCEGRWVKSHSCVKALSLGCLVHLLPLSWVWHGDWSLPFFHFIKSSQKVFVSQRKCFPQPPGVVWRGETFPAFATPRPSLLLISEEDLFYCGVCWGALVPACWHEVLGSWSTALATGVLGAHASSHLHLSKLATDHLVPSLESMGLVFCAFSVNVW